MTQHTLTRAAQVMDALEDGATIQRHYRPSGPSLLSLMHPAGHEIPAWQQAISTCMRSCKSITADPTAGIETFVLETA